MKALMTEPVTHTTYSLIKPASSNTSIGISEKYLG